MSETDKGQKAPKRVLFVRLRDLQSATMRIAGEEIKALKAFLESLPKNLFPTITKARWIAFQLFAGSSEPFRTKDVELILRTIDKAQRSRDDIRRLAQKVLKDEAFKRVKKGLWVVNSIPWIRPVRGRPTDKPSAPVILFEVTRKLNPERFLIIRLCLKICFEGLRALLEELREKYKQASDNHYRKQIISKMSVALDWFAISIGMVYMDSFLAVVEKGYDPKEILSLLPKRSRDDYLPYYLYELSRMSPKKLKEAIALWNKKQVEDDKVLWEHFVFPKEGEPPFLKLKETNEKFPSAPEETESG